MDTCTYLIIGGGIAGTTAAETIRMKDKEAKICIVSDEPYRLYSRIMLSKPNFFLEKIPFEQIWLRDEKSYKKNNITFIGGKKATNLDHENKKITLDDNTEIQYEKLLLAIGVNARAITVPGSEKEGMFCLRNLDQGKGIINAVKTTKDAVTVGGGFISFEMANLFHMAGATTSIIIRESRFWENILDENASTIVENAIEKNGVQLIKNAEIEKVSGDENITSITLKNGTEIPTDIVVCGIGTTCETEWLKDIEIDRAIRTDEFMQTNIKDIWAAGDAIQYQDPILEEVVQLGNWVNAQAQGRIAGLNMAGEETAFDTVSFYTTHGFDTSVTFVGNVRPQKKSETIIRKGTKENEYSQFITVNNRIVGAVLVNETKIMQPIVKLIKNKTDISEIKEKLTNSSIDIKTLNT